ncbi:MAG TPA: 3-isopropylmalate dehydratase [Ramlibacter sp.]|uniref:LeuD/DmdB family oxidoreductase small subunit n=1 Tax=Ramlibacter sp. TaxID=1917967 RepID=UPI002D7F01F8|nr:3-isopropylmalate dehydratase [Ramlibacter sp.]HET8744970.1 3-isopropylmalate dehydratase [Ramlibacter sp.]
MPEPIRAGAYRVGDDVKALEIMPTRFKSSSALSDAELAKAAFADLDPSFSARALAGDYGIVVAGVNFGGGGKTVEGPVFALRGAGVKLVIAESFARYFLRNAINNGFPILVCEGISRAVQTGQQLSVDLDTARITNLATGQVLAATPLSSTALEILAAGGLVPYARRKLARQQGAAR